MVHCRSGSYRLLFGVLVASLLSGPSFAQGPPGRTSPSPDALQTIDSLRQVGDFRTALGQLNDLAQAHPESVDVLWRYAVLWSDYGKATDSERTAVGAYQQALKRADQALRVAEGSAWAHLSKAAAAGRAALHAGSNKRSIQLSRAVKEHEDRAIELDSTLAAAYHIRGVWHREVASLGFFTRAVVQTVYGGLPDASYEDAVADLKRASALETRAHHHLELGRTYLKMGETEAARAQLQIALEVPPADPFAPQNKAKARRLLTRLEQSKM
jgi:tetratricopeptide (TPR) repeat protein